VFTLCFRHNAEYYALPAHPGLGRDRRDIFRDLRSHRSLRGARAVPADQGGSAGQFHRGLSPADIGTTAPQGPVPRTDDDSDTGGSGLQADRRGPARGYSPAPQWRHVGLVRCGQKV